MLSSASRENTCVPGKDQDAGKAEVVDERRHRAPRSATRPVRRPRVAGQLPVDNGNMKLGRGAGKARRRARRAGGIPCVCRTRPWACRHSVENASITLGAGRTKAGTRAPRARGRPSGGGQRPCACRCSVDNASIEVGGGASKPRRRCGTRCNVSPPHGELRTGWGTCGRASQFRESSTVRCLAARYGF